MAGMRLESNVAKYLTIGAEIATSLGAPILAGHLLDDRFGTSPWLLLAGCVVGIGLFIALAVRLAADRSASGRNPSERPSSDPSNSQTRRPE